MHELYHRKGSLNTHLFTQLHREAPTVLMAALIPHRDSRRLLQAWSGKLFAAGLSGAWSFPWAAPLGIISRFLTGEELTGLAHKLRGISLAEDKGGKIKTGPPVDIPFPDLAGVYADLSLFGPALDLRLPQPLFTGSAATALVHAFSYAEENLGLQPWQNVPVLASAIVKRTSASGEGPRDNLPSPPNLPPPPAISFRAAAVANMIFRPITGGAVPSFEWQIGELHWLPAIARKQKRTSYAVSRGDM
jgi:hypothetical protein